MAGMGSVLLLQSLRTGEPERMMGGERTRAYRYGMTLLCVGALFNWLGLTENNSEPVKFIGYTCLASGALLVCMAICFWANSAHRHVHNQVRPEQNNEAVVNIVDPGRERREFREKPPDYDTVADLSPPPSYDDAIRLSPAYLPPACGGIEGPSVDRCTEVTSPSTQTVTVSITPSSPVEKPTGESPKPDSSPLTRVIRLSSRLLRRTLSNVDHTDEEAPVQNRPSIHRSSSAQEIKDS
ncbi:uncharacterized protein isoform X2 [Rhodnius prolixus]|uniref:uncharacterized protein isoform X2 n=1 Tax=Rhodnius prolixus TaxID=13249 RepID=UPI003D189994